MKKKSITKKEMLQQMLFSADFLTRMINDRAYSGTESRPYISAYLEVKSTLTNCWHFGALTEAEYTEKSDKLWSVWYAYCRERKIDPTSFQERGE
jgi:hypothetical protein